MKRKKIVLAGTIVCMLFGSMTVPAQTGESVSLPAVQVSAAKRATTTTEQSATKGKKDTKSQKKAKQNKKKAKKYIGKKLSSLVKAIGKYKKLSKAASCYYENEYDGIAKYDGFVVYCHTENKKTWIVDSVE
ncbi:MAG: hypothetical protein BHW06_10040 [Clostridium sp. 44_14]|nr:MAG: hypothetical protein BHW06_10040 [Clostridium sp. 44_14]